MRRPDVARAKAPNVSENTVTYEFSSKVEHRASKTSEDMRIANGDVHGMTASKGLGISGFETRRTRFSLRSIASRRWLGRASDGTSAPGDFKERLEDSSSVLLPHELGNSLSSVSQMHDRSVRNAGSIL